MATKTLTIAEQKDFLRRIGLPAGTVFSRRASWRKFQRASAWAWFDDAAAAVGSLEIDGKCGPATTVHARASMRHGYRVSPHFRLSEFACPCGGKRRGCKRVWYSRYMVRKLETIRARLYSSGLTILSGYRCPGHNATLPGSSPTSAHLDGNAADIPQRHEPGRFRGLGFHGIEVRRRNGLVSHVDIQAGLRADTVFYA